MFNWFNLNHAQYILHSLCVGETFHNWRVKDTASNWRNLTSGNGTMYAKRMEHLHNIHSSSHVNIYTQVCWVLIQGVGPLSAYSNSNQTQYNSSLKFDNWEDNMKRLNNFCIKQPTVTCLCAAILTDARMGKDICMIMDNKLAHEAISSLGETIMIDCPSMNLWRHARWEWLTY